MNIEELQKIVGMKSISDMTDDELREHCRTVRRSRMTSKVPDKPVKEPKVKSAKKEDLTEEQIQQLLAALEE